ncbi:HAMP domain-containing histidine kinase [Agromyces sp. SYSU K20354]|uniref:sensor histidine kinase n=1 Tax=Agromyces cavernae TaxID=2898659 RepID=UPI001E2B6E34|nr:HAMP domain-containing sensor histidine kinase [Agromyces cavernae]MCD2443241.1 HAMP domain-containing histidine kinase [Agromyces cavernae]
MTHPGDPGYASAARATATAAADARTSAATAAASLSAPPEPGERVDTSPAEHTEAPSRRPPWTLERRLLVVLAGLVAAVSLVVGIVSVTVFHASSVASVDAELRSAMNRAELNIRGPVPLPGGTAGPSLLLDVAGQSAGTLAAVVPDQGAASAAYISEEAEGGIVELGDRATRALSAVPADGELHTIHTGSPLGSFRALAERKDLAPDTRVVLALPLAGVERSTTELAVTIAVVALSGLIVAIGFGSLIVRRALAPLSRMTSTALEVSELPLARGDVALTERVAVDDPHTEVGRLGTAFNRMLGHVASALSAREQSEQKVRRFVADASHELRTPLASIRGYAELTRMHRGELPDDVVHALGRIESESVRMTELVEDLLLLARLDEGRELVHARVDLGALVADAVGDAQVAGPDQDWSVELAEEAVEVSGDRARLHQVIANLLANARIHTPAGTSVRVRLAREGDLATITVADDGPGIDPQVRDTLFERFERGDASRSRRAGGTGLGLAIVKAVVEAHHGSVGVVSESGSTVFTVELPLSKPGE